MLPCSVVFHASFTDVLPGNLWIFKSSYRNQWTAASALALLLSPDNLLTTYERLNLVEFHQLVFYSSKD